MVLFRVACVLFVGFTFLTSLIVGKENDTSSLKIIKEYDELKLVFKQSDSAKGSDVFDEIKEFSTGSYFLKIEAVPTWAQFIVFQAHVYLHNVTLRYNTDKAANNYVTGQNIGLVQNITAGGAEFFLENGNPFNVTVLLAVIAYNKSVPIPGGCNMEFEVSTAPWLHINVTGPMVVVDSQPAKPPRVSGLGAMCDMPALRYEVYHVYLPEKDFLIDTYFSSIQAMLTVDRIRQNSRKVKEYEVGNMRHLFSAYHGTGTVFAILATDPATTYAAAYVPALTYSCSPARYTDTCQVLTSMFSRCLCALVFFLGLFVCFYGHSFFQSELFLFTTLMGSILFYVLLVPLNWSDSTNVMLATVGGVTLANFYMVLWWVSGSPMLSIIMATVSLGYLITSVLFYSALADLPVMENSVNYWMAFLLCMLVVTLLVTPQTTRVNLLACSVVGAYAAVVPIDIYIGANLKYIFINVMRRATVPDFNQAVIDPPFQTKDGVLTGLWLVLAVAGYIAQAQRFADRPMFPRPENPLGTLWGLTPSSSHSEFTHKAEERAPLLYDTSSPTSDNVFS